MTAPTLRRLDALSQALLLLWLGFHAFTGWLGPDLAALLDEAKLEFLPLGQALLLVAGGLGVGAAGGFAASRHTL